MELITQIISLIIKVQSSSQFHSNIKKKEVIELFFKLTNIFLLVI